MREEIEKLLREQFMIFWKMSQEYSYNKTQVYDEQRRDIHTKIKEMLGASMLAVQQAIEEAKNSLNIDEERFLFYTDESEARAIAFDWAHKTEEILHYYWGDDE